MPISTRNAWEMHRKIDTRPQLTDMLTFLERRATTTWSIDDGTDRYGHAKDKCPKTQYAFKNCKADLHNMAICSKRKHIIDGAPKISAVISQESETLSRMLGSEKCSVMNA